MPMRLRWPPENWCGKRRMRPASRPTRCEHLGDVARRARARRDEAVHDGRLADDVGDAHARIERGVRVLEDHLDREPLGARGLVLVLRDTGGPSRSARPSLGSRMRATMRPSVDLPQPDSPTRPTTSPSRTARFTPSTRVHRRARDRRAPSAARDAAGEVERASRSACDTPRSSSRAGGACAHDSGCRQRRRARRRGGCARPGAGAAGVGGARAALAKGAARRRGRSSEGVIPGICASGRPGALRLGHRVEQPARVGMHRAVEDLVDGARLHDATGVHHADVVGQPRDHRQVVGDPDERRCRSRGTASASRTGSGPGWSRRARWWARRR